MIGALVALLSTKYSIDHYIDIEILTSGCDDARQIIE